VKRAKSVCVGGGHPAVPLIRDRWPLGQPALQLGEVVRQVVADRLGNERGGVGRIGLR
jgi:hypothetical protein